MEYNDIILIPLWQQEGQSTVTVEGKEYSLQENDTLLVRVGQS